MFLNIKKKEIMKKETIENLVIGLIALSAFILSGLYR
jgi:hypothetical protein